jgi:hypothetical protein
MTQHWSQEDWNNYLLNKCPAPKVASKSTKQKHDLALLVLVNRLQDECGINDGGVWRKGMEGRPNTIYLEYPAVTNRKFRFDLACPSRHLAIEIHGGGPGMAHHTITGRQRDMEKSRLAQLEGWMVLECNWKEVADGTALDLIKRALEVRADV